jgi:LacI family transcriptional regulator
MACNDERGRQVLDACRQAGVCVPEDVSIIGVDNDEVYCNLAEPPLSSVAYNAELGGFQAAELLDKMMKSRIKDPGTIIVEPLHVVARRSSDVIAVSDKDVANAISYIQQTKGRGVTVEDVARAAAVSRRVLETRFPKVTGRSILQEIQRAKVSHAQWLLETTDLTVPQIAELAGYNSASYFIHVFQRAQGTTPGKYRATLRVKA